MINTPRVLNKVPVPDIAQDPDILGFLGRLDILLVLPKSGVDHKPIKSKSNKEAQ
jgi:hypothetical protein